MNFADFYALMPADNADAIAAGESVAFPSNGVIGGTSVTRIDDSSFTLVTAGTYLVSVTATTTGAAQLVLTLDGTELPYTVVGQTDGGMLVLQAIVTATAGSVLTVSNPVAATAPITLTANAGGTDPVAAHLVILQLA